MRNTIIFLAVMLSAVSMMAERYYVYFSDGRVWGYPKELVKEVKSDDAKGYSLTLLNDSVLTWSNAEVKQLSELPPIFPAMTTLSFVNELNDELTDNVDAVITDEGRAVASVASIGKYLTPTFELDDPEAKAYVNEVAQVSGVSRLRFADEVTYVVTNDRYRQLSYVKLSDEVWSQSDITTERIPLTVDMLSTNAPTSIEGEGLDMMLDGNNSTFFHSTWSEDKVYEVDLTKQVYVQIDLRKSVKDFQFRYVSRPKTERYNIQEWKIEVSADGVIWNEVKVLNETSGLAVSGQGVDYTSPVISTDEAFSHLRFTATKVGYKNYLCLAELYLFEVTDIEEKPTLLKPATYVYSMVPMGREVMVDIDWPTEQVMPSVPRIDIDIEGGATVTSKDYYLNASIRIQGQGIWPDFMDSVQIKGRGNTSWRDFDKKPYRLKFAKSVKPFGWGKGKNWNLLAQAQTGSMMTNPLAMKIARMVGAAAANDVMPVELYMNGKYLGSYLFTQKTGLANNSVDLEDESQATLLELDRYFDEVYKFKSASFNLPVNIKDPDLSEGESLLSLEQIQEDFNTFEAAVKGNSNFERLVDLDKLIRFMLVNELVLNTELGHPKSAFLYRENLNYMNTAYTLGPVWDFDWAYGYENNRNYCTTGATNDIFANYDTRPGSRFFTALWQSSPWVKCLYYRLWKHFMANHLKEVLDYVDDYYAFAKSSFVNNTAVWSDGNGYETVAGNMKQWLAKRADFLVESLADYDDEASTPYTFADVNNDGKINNEDLSMLLAHMFEEKQTTFVEEQADIDANGSVSASDLAWMCNQFARMENVETSSQMDWSEWHMKNDENENPLSLTITETSNGRTWNLATSLTNNHPYVACIMDLTLPEGITANTNLSNFELGERIKDSHIFTGKRMADNLYRIIGYSPHNLPISGTKGILFNLSLTANASISEGTYPISIKKICFVKADGTEVLFKDALDYLSVSANGIYPITNVNQVQLPADIYDMQGRLIRHQATSLEEIEKGIYILGGGRIIRK